MKKREKKKRGGKVKRGREMRETKEWKRRRDGFKPGVYQLFR